MSYSLRKNLHIGQIIEMTIGKSDEVINGYDYYYKKENRARKHYMITDIYKHFVVCKDKNGSYASFNRGDLVINGIVKGGDKNCLKSKL